MALGGSGTMAEDRPAASHSLCPGLLPIAPAAAGRWGGQRAARAAFTLIELLVCIGVIALLVSLLLPALAAARQAGRAGVCLSNLRHTALICAAYANDYRGYGPAIGQPYTEIPNWALVVQASSGREGSTPAEMYSTASVLVCPTASAFYAQPMTRTYAMNATGHAGLPAGGGGDWPVTRADPDNYDDPDHPAFLRLDRVELPSETPLLMDGAVTPIAGDAPPPTRCASVLDLRQPEHVAHRLGRFHGSGTAGGTASRFQAGAFDGSARSYRNVVVHWMDPLP